MTPVVAGIDIGEREHTAVMMRRRDGCIEVLDISRWTVPWGRCCDRLEVGFGLWCFFRWVVGEP